MTTTMQVPMQSPSATLELPAMDIEENTPRAVEFILTNFGPTTLTAIGPDAGNIRSYWLDDTSSVAAIDWLDAHARHGMNLYYSPNQPIRGLRKKPNKSEISLIRCGAYADIDFKDGRTPEAAWAAIMALPRAPTFTIMTGGGFQPIWKLLEPVEATTETIAKVEDTSRYIADLQEEIRSKPLIASCELGGPRP